MQLQSELDPEILHALSRGHLVDLTTYGRRTGLPRRIELVFQAIDGRVILSGMPGRVRDWLLNIRAGPRLIFHLKSVVTADLPGTGREVTEPSERRYLMERVAANWGRADVERMMEHSPLVEVLIDGYAPA